MYWLKELSKTLSILGKPKDFFYKNKIEQDSLALLKGVFINKIFLVQR